MYISLSERMVLQHFKNQRDSLKNETNDLFVWLISNIDFEAKKYIDDLYL